MFLDRLATHILAFEGDSHVEWFEGNFEDYEADKIRRLGPDSVNPKRVTLQAADAVMTFRAGASHRPFYFRPFSRDERKDDERLVCKTVSEV